ncbi:MAG TPA: Smr/MutS family protein, partial [Burkholderiales bacterium]|nr:Smr/MutS family protein [Burkholderiales bacterium]
ETAAEEADPDYVPAIGDRVRTGSLGFEGVVRAVEGSHAELDVLGKRIRARVDDLRPLKKGGAQSQEVRQPVRVNVSLAERAGGRPSELNVIGCTVDEATTRAARFIDEALLTDAQTLRVVHGHGTGQLRKALGAYFKQHPLVAKVTLAPPDEGGNAVTLVELKD